MKNSRKEEKILVKSCKSNSHLYGKYLSVKVNTGPCQYWPSEIYAVLSMHIGIELDRLQVFVVYYYFTLNDRYFA